MPRIWWIRSLRERSTITERKLGSPPNPFYPPIDKSSNRDPDLLCGFEVDDQLELRRGFNGQIRRLSSFKDLIYIRRGPPVHAGVAGPIGHQATCFDQLLVCMHSWQAILKGEVHDACAVVQEEAIRQDEERTWQRSANCRNRIFE